MDDLWMIGRDTITTTWDIWRSSNQFVTFFVDNLPDLSSILSPLSVPYLFGTLSHIE